MSVRLAAKISYLEDRLARRVDVIRCHADRAGCDPALIPASPVTTSPPAKGAGRAAAGGCPWVLPGHLRYTGAKGAESVNLSDIFRPSSCFFVFGSKVWADAR